MTTGVARGGAAIVQRLPSTTGPRGQIVDGYEQVCDTTLTFVTLKVGIEDAVVLRDAVDPVVPAPVVGVVPAPVVGVVPVPVVPVVPAVLPVAPVVEPELVMLPELASIMPVTSTFWFTYWLRLTLDPDGFSIKVLCAPMVAVDPALPVVPVVPVAELPAPLSIFVSMN
jgi:hypothetical protein